MNDGIMAIMMSLRKTDPSSMLNVFSVAVELASVPLAILVAIVFASMETSVFVLLLFAMSLGMLVLKQFAEMRNELEVLVDERTEELRIKTLELEEQATHDKLTGLFNRRYRRRLPATRDRKVETLRPAVHDRAGRHRSFQAGQRQPLPRDR